MNEDKKLPLSQAIYIILSSIIIAVLLFFCTNLYYENSELKKETELKWSQISSRDSTIYNLREEIASYTVQIFELERQANFMNTYIAICPIDGKGLFHQYGCDNYDKYDTFKIYDILSAEKNGFAPCSLCENNITAEPNTEQTVYITDTGSKYHRSGCSYLKSKNPITKSKAIEKGHTACSRCNP